MLFRPYRLFRGPNAASRPARYRVDICCPRYEGLPRSETRHQSSVRPTTAGYIGVRPKRFHRLRPRPKVCDRAPRPRSPARLVANATGSSAAPAQPPTQRASRTRGWRQIGRPPKPVLCAFSSIGRRRSTSPAPVDGGPFSRCENHNFKNAKRQRRPTGQCTRLRRLLDPTVDRGCRNLGLGRQYHADEDARGNRRTLSRGRFPEWRRPEPI